jgi:hypothetical protein
MPGALCWFFLFFDLRGWDFFDVKVFLGFYFLTGLVVMGEGGRCLGCGSEWDGGRCFDFLVEKLKNSTPGVFLKSLTN